MMSNLGHSLPSLRSDLVLIHAPAFFDFRNRRDIYFPFLGTSGDVPITPLYEYFPVGFKTLQRFLGERGHEVRILNLSSILLRHPGLDFDKIALALDTPLVGIDLHWMVHVQGSLAVAERIHSLRPDIKIIFGGISSTYFASELIQYPYVDMVMQGYNTHEPMAQLLPAIKAGRAPSDIENLMWKDHDGNVRMNDFAHKPNVYGCGIDWSQQPRDAKSTALPIMELLSTQNAGCAYNCGWCGGSREAFRRVFKRHRTMARKPKEEISYEFQTIRNIPDVNNYHFYSVGSYNESPQGMHFFLDLVGDTGLKGISYEQYFLTSEDILKHMVRANKRTSITLSPESHDHTISKLSGRGVYSNEEMEAWIERALEIGIHNIDIWYFIGMPQQTPQSVDETVDYCAHLLHKFKGRNVNPMICPMIPFLDPASTFFEFPEQHGYRVFHRSAEQHRKAMESASLLNRINYETQWLSREQLVDVGFRAVRRLMEIKGSVSALPKFCVEDYNAAIDDALEFIPVVHEADCIKDPVARARALDALGDDILKRNNMILFDGVMNQAFPLNRGIGGRWFDEMGWDAATLEAAESA
ncbi:cobalamin-dependent protein [Methylomonas sp. SURF-2]|uniref:Cobalamin-dependent protein n=1 Tax=Methylomonas subterranea TaxID=2952225 RepID=A0ABT1TJA6_9GAMM|nr:cobalamin-dependent protein [Methylomonas sp. SURF-2]MCQ8105399.1 cobalamin-dependent protein [Methylomonas sp. SURF-2]